MWEAPLLSKAEETLIALPKQANAAMLPRRNNELCLHEISVQVSHIAPLLLCVSFVYRTFLPCIILLSEFSKLRANTPISTTLLDMRPGQL